LCNWARDYAVRLQRQAEFVEMMANLMTQNQKFGLAKTHIELYATDQEERFSMPAKGIALGIEMHIDANNKALETLRKASNDDFSVLKDLDYQIAQINTIHKQAWEMLSTAATFVIYDIVEPAQSENPSGPLPYRISERERVLLLQRVDDLFGDDLKRFYAQQAAEKKGMKGNPEDSNWLIFAVNYIRETLAAQTYEKGTATRKK
jgi:hypothetical protein